jgi:hypothetical protein
VPVSVRSGAGLPPDQSRAGQQDRGCAEQSREHPGKAQAVEEPGQLSPVASIDQQQRQRPGRHRRGHERAQYRREQSARAAKGAATAAAVSPTMATVRASTPNVSASAVFRTAGWDAVPT